jgi:hypothetical protein
MGRRCSVCMHADRKAIDREIIRGIKYEDIARKFNLTYDMIAGHANKHVKGAIKAAEKRRKWTTAELADEILDISIGTAHEARADKVYGAVGTLMNAPVKVLEIMSKATDDDKGECGLMQMRLELKAMRETPKEHETN